MNIEIIPARAVNKRIKNKNITNFFGKLLIYNSIKTAIDSKLFYIGNLEDIEFAKTIYLLNKQK